MYKLVKKILDEAKESNVDISVAYDYVAKDIGYTAKLKEAQKFLREKYEVITALRRKGHETDIKVICDMKEAGNAEGVRNYIDDLKNRGIV